MNVNTGEVLAMASYPSYEPQWFVGKLESDKWNYMNDSETHPLLNKAIQGTYEPGSVYKMITAIAGLETGAITSKEKSMIQVFIQNIIHQENVGIIQVTIEDMDI